MNVADSRGRHGSDACHSDRALGTAQGGGVQGSEDDDKTVSFQLESAASAMGDAYVATAVKALTPVTLIRRRLAS